MVLAACEPSTSNGGDSGNGGGAGGAGGAGQDVGPGGGPAGGAVPDAAPKPDGAQVGADAAVDGDAAVGTDAATGRDGAVETDAVVEMDAAVETDAVVETDAAVEPDAGAPPQECEALEALMAAVMAKVADMRFQQRPTDRGPPLPDPWERLAERFDREVDVALRELGRELNNGDPQGFLSRDARIQKRVSTPGARVATAELIGRDTYLRIGGARFAEGVFSPEVLTKYGPDGEHDPYGVSIEGMEAEVAALETLAGRTNSRTWQAQMNLAPRLGDARYYEHMVNILAAPTATALLDANDALAQDIASLAR